MNYNQIVAEFFLGNKVNLKSILSEKKQDELYKLIQDASTRYARNTEFSKFIIDIYLENLPKNDFKKNMHFMQKELLETSFDIFTRKLFLYILKNPEINIAQIALLWEIASEKKDFELPITCKSKLQQKAERTEYNSLKEFYKTKRNKTIQETEIHNILLELVLKKSKGSDLEEIFQWECSLNHWYGMELVTREIKDRKKNEIV